MRSLNGLPGALHLGKDDFAGVVAGIRAELGDLPMLLSGMVGSTVGWIEADYCFVPVNQDSLAGKLFWIDPRTAIVPGVAQADSTSPDVMRGEEVQFFGAAKLLGSEAPFIFCQPGTHSKWAKLVDGKILEFATSMTGEVFGLLKSHSVLAAALGGKVEANSYFEQGVAHSAESEALNELFRVRAGTLLLGWDNARASAYASGLLIGAEVRGRLMGDCRVCLVADEILASLYRAAIVALGGEVVPLGVREALVAGVGEIARSAFGFGDDR